MGGQCCQVPLQALGGDRRTSFPNGVVRAGVSLFVKALPPLQQTKHLGHLVLFLAELWHLLERPLSNLPDKPAATLNEFRAQTLEFLAGLSKEEDLGRVERLCLIYLVKAVSSDIGKPRSLSLEDEPVHLAGSYAGLPFSSVVSR